MNFEKKSRGLTIINNIQKMNTNKNMQETTRNISMKFRRDIRKEMRIYDLFTWRTWAKL